MDSVSKLGNLEYAKDLWILLTETKYDLTHSVLEYELNRVKNQLLCGVLCFKPPSTETDKILESKIPENVFDFIINLRKLLGVDALQAYDLLCDYLIYEFKGYEVGLKACLVNDARVNLLITDIWEFYRSERLFLLKCVNLLILYSTDKQNPKQEAIAEFLDSYDGSQILDNLILQLEVLLKEPYPPRYDHGHLMTQQLQMKWHISNLREQIEVLQNLIFYGDMNQLDSSIFMKILQLCTETSFGRQYVTYVGGGSVIREYGKIIGYLENILLLQCLNLSRNGTPFDWTQSADFLRLDKAIDTLNDAEEHGPVVLAWNLIKSLYVSDSDVPCIYDKLGHLALNLGAFEYLRNILLSEMVQDTSTKLSEIMFRTLYDFVFIFTSKFDRAYFHEISGLRQLIGPLLRHPIVADNVWTVPGSFGLRSLISVLSERFPAEFVPFVKAVGALASSGPTYISELYQLVMNIENYTEILGPNAKIPTSSSVLKLYKDRCPLANSSFIIPKGVQGYFLDRNAGLLTWKCKFNIFEGILHELKCIILQVTYGYHVSEDTIDKVQASLEFLQSWFTLDKEITNQEKEVINQVLFLIDMLKSRSLPSTLLGSCLGICLALLNSFPTEMTNNLRSMKVFPTVQCVPTNLHLIFNTQYFSSNAIGVIVTKQESSVGKYPVLITYLDYLFKLLKSEPYVDAAVKTHLDVILPGVLFILAEVFPWYHSWSCPNERDHDRITLACVKILHEILTMDYVADKNPEVTPPLLLLQKIVLHCLHNLNASKVFLKLVASGEALIQCKMERQLNWLSEGGTSMVFFVRLSLSILNRLLMLKELIQDKNELSPLEVEIYSSPHKRDSLRVVPIITSYINNAFCRNLPIMAVLLLTRFAAGLPKTLLPCMGIEADVVRDIIYRKLTSSVETVSLKESLIHLLGACIDNQPGMCEALFNIHVTRIERRKDEKNNVHGGCLLYIYSLMDKVAEGEEEVTSRLYAAAVDCICTIWIGDNPASVEYLRNKEGFWESFCSPLLAKPTTYVYPYTQVFTIIALELFEYRDNIHPSLLGVFKEFYADNTNSPYIGWSEFLASVFKNGSFAETPKLDVHTSRLPVEKMPLNVQLLLTMKRFWGISLRFLPFKLSPTQVMTIASHIMEAIQAELKSLNKRTLTMLVELYLLVIESTNEFFFDDGGVLKRHVHNLLLTTSSMYGSIAECLRKTILALIVKSVNYMAEDLHQDVGAAETMMQAACDIVSIELVDLVETDKNVVEQLSVDQTQPDSISEDEPEKCNKNDGQSKTKSKQAFSKTTTCNLSLCLLYKLLAVSNEHMLWFKQEKFSNIIPLLVRVSGDILKFNHNVGMVPYHLDVVRRILNVLLLLVKNEVTGRVFDVHIQDNLWWQLIPPKYLVESDIWMYTEWAEVYQQSLDLISAFLSLRGLQFVENTITFVGMHLEFLIASIAALRYTLEPSALKLSITTLNFVRVLSAYQNIWRLSHPLSFNSIIRAVMMRLYSAVALLVNPSTLKILIKGRVKEDKQKVPCSKVTETGGETESIENQVLKMACICLAVLQTFTPRLLYLIQECPSPVEWQPILELDFDVPVLEADVSMSSLSFGTLITLTSLCTQTLSKGSRIHTPRVPLKGVRANSGLGSSLAVDKHYTSLVFEMTLELITSQGLLYLITNNLSSNQKDIFRRSLNSEMTFVWVYITRIFRQRMASNGLYNYSSHSLAYTMYKKYLMFLSPAKNEPSFVKSKSSESSRRNLDEAVNKAGNSPRSPMEYDSDSTEEYVHFISCVFNKYIVKLYPGI